MPSLESRLTVWWIRWARQRRQQAANRTTPPAVQPAAPSARHRRQARITLAPLDDQLVYRVAPAGRPGEPASAGRILYLHGGAYVRPINRHHWNFVVDLARRSGCEIVVPLYPLAPRHNGLTAFEFVSRLYRREIADERPLILMGDSAGGGLAVALAGWIRDQFLPAPRQLMLLSPWLDVEIPHPQAVQLQAADPMLTLDGLRRAGRAYAGPLGGAHPVISPARGDPRGLPPMAIHVGGRELIGPDVIDYSRRVQALGGSVELNHAPAMMHVWPLLGFPEARAARALIARQLRTALGELPSPVTPLSGRPVGAAA